MILVDTSVWVDFFNGVQSAEADYLDALLGTQLVVVGDLVLAELLQGFRRDADCARAVEMLEPLEFRSMVGRRVALKSAEHYRTLRRRGVTVRKTLDVLIGTYCMMSGLPLLHRDRDFDPMARYLGLQVVAVK